MFQSVLMLVPMFQSVLMLVPMFQSVLMLSAAERQELAENAMEQLASGLNKAAEAMQSGEEEEEAGEVKPDLANMQDKELYQLLEEAYSYKSKKDRQGKSEMFRVSNFCFLKNL